MTLQGKRAIVLGGSSGIGLAATNQLVSEGVAVIAASRHPQRAQQSVRAGVELQVCDVQDREALRALFAASANAVADAVGCQLCELPITAERVYAALHQVERPEAA